MKSIEYKTKSKNRHRHYIMNDSLCWKKGMTGFDEAPVEIKEKTTLEPKGLLAAIRTRRSIRQFTNQPVMPLVKLVQPMAKQTVIDDHFFFKKAPAAIVIVAKDKVNGALAAANMALMAEACGLGVLYSDFFSTAVNRSRKLKKKLLLKRGEKAIITLVLGYSGVTYHRSVQKEAVSYRQY